MDFTIKTYKVPVDRTGEVATFKEVTLDAKNLQSEVPVEIKFSHLIPVEATNINNWNNMQISMANKDETINTILKKVLCKPKN